MAKKKRTIEMFRQGDVIIIRADPEVEKLGAPVPRENGRVVLAHGDLTGHAHVIRSPEAELFERLDQTSDEAAQALGARILRTFFTVQLRHEEHAAIDIPPGYWLVRVQREYSPGELRNVAD